VIIPIRKNSDIGELAKRILDTFVNPFAVKENAVYLSASVGIALYPEHGREAGILITNASLALQAGKQKGKHGYGVYEESMIETSYAKHLMESALRTAIDRRALFVHYQPVVDMDSGRIIGSEALARWEHPERGMISPLQFIPMAEETDLIHPLGEYVFRTACSQHSHWESESISSGKIAINFSSKQFRQPDFLSTIKQIIDETGIEPSRLMIEITESILIEDLEQSAKILSDLKCLGVNIGIDDFGTGYSSLAYLKNLPIDVLKIDQSFIRDMERNPSDKKIISAIIAMAHGLNIQVVAEGVETTAQFDFLKSAACDFAQGFLFSRAIPPEEMESLLKAGENCMS
jgi:EAL domain-containing protein (putative c-di-GMP-specific phosphodiesterase class I)